MEKLEKYLTEKIEEHNKKIGNKGKKKSGKGLIIAALALLLAGITVVSGCLGKKKDKNNNEPTKPTTSTISYEDIENDKIEDMVSIENIGLEYEQPVIENEKSEYGEVTGDVIKEEIKEKDDILWKDQEAVDKSDDIGKAEIDDKEGTLEVKPDGDVVEKEEDYEIKDENGNVVDSGSNETGIPDGYAWDSALNKYVKEDEVGKFVYVDATYYVPDGTIMFSEGEIVLKETLEKIKNQLTTTKPEVIVPEETLPQETMPEETIPEETIPEETIPEETQPEKNEPTGEVADSLGGIVNVDGTYTIYGETYKSKEDFEQFLLHPEQYGYYNGMILSLEDIEALFNQNQKAK